jgi:DNA invertase Pin-like site-specific DNA recombinase
MRDISRLFRDTRLLLNFLDELDKLEIRIVTPMGGLFDTSSSYDRMTMTIMTSMATLEMRNRQESIKRAINNKKK